MPFLLVLQTTMQKYQLLCQIKKESMTQHPTDRLSAYSDVSRAGFTLIEFLLYLALSSLVISSITLLGLNVVLNQQRSQVQLTVAANIQSVSDRIQYEIRNAESIVSASTDELCVLSDQPSRSPVRLYRESQAVRISWGGGGLDCSSPSFDEQLTDSSVQVTALEFSDLSQNDSEHVSFSLTVESNGGRSEWQRTESYDANVEVRSAK